MDLQTGELFHSSATYYAKYRAGYPPEVFEHLAASFGLDGTQRVLDLGCGTGQVAIPLAASVKEIVAVDPASTMLEEGKASATRAGVTNIRWVQGDSHRLAAMGLRGLTLVTMGASFHWMERSEVLEICDNVVEPGGAVVIVSGSRGLDPEWEQTVTAVRTRWLGDERRTGLGVYTHPAQRHEEVLAASPFSSVEFVDWAWSICRDLDSVVGLQFSYSYCAPALFGSRVAEFEAELRKELVAANPSGLWTEHIRTQVMVARRP